MVAATAGALLGGLGGAAAGEAVIHQTGVEITVKPVSAQVLAITQASDVEFRLGVRVLSDSRTTRVSHCNDPGTKGFAGHRFAT